MDPEWFLVEVRKIDSLEWRKIISSNKEGIRFFPFSRVIGPGLIYWDRSEGFVFNTMPNV